MCGVPRRDTIGKNKLEGYQVTQASKKITDKRLKWYGHLMRMNERRAHSEKNARFGHTRENKTMAAKHKVERYTCKRGEGL